MPGTVFSALPDHRVIVLGGRDAVAFAQAQCMNDVAALGDGQWQWNGWLTPKGRVIALFALLRLDATTLWLLAMDADADELAASLRRFVFRSKLAIDASGELHASGAFMAPAAASAASFSGDEGHGVELDFGGEGGPRALRIDRVAAADDATACTRWREFDLAHGLPRLEPSQAGQWTPQQLSLDRLRAYSVKKGCYPGQEIVARTHFLGQAKRGLALLEADAPLAAGSDVREGGDVVGKVASSAGKVALAVLPLDRQFADLSAAGTALRKRPLQDGLAR